MAFGRPCRGVATRGHANKEARIRRHRASDALSSRNWVSGHCSRGRHNGMYRTRCVRETSQAAPTTPTWQLIATCLLLAQSRHELVHCTCPLSGVKRTWPIAVQMSAYDPKRTSPCRAFWSEILSKLGYKLTAHWEERFTLSNGEDTYLTFVQVINLHHTNIIGAMSV
jgi:hypothetical protein